MSFSPAILFSYLFIVYLTGHCTLLQIELTKFADFSIFNLCAETVSGKITQFFISVLGTDFKKTRHFSFCLFGVLFLK